jgi:hypothetical protein
VAGISDFPDVAGELPSHALDEPPPRIGGEKRRGDLLSSAMHALPDGTANTREMTGLVSVAPHSRNESRKQVADKLDSG